MDSRITLESSGTSESPRGSETRRGGMEWLIEAFGCRPSTLTEIDPLRSLFERIVVELNLSAIGEPSWHRFPDTGGITGFWMLRESHLAIHTFPEYGSACINLFCCSWRGSPAWTVILEEALLAKEISVREFSRSFVGHGPTI